VQRFVSKLILVFIFGGCATDAGSIGAVLGHSRTDGRLTVRRAPPGYPAAESGIGAGDEILLIDGRDVRNMSPDDVHRLLQGEVGTTVNLTVLRRGKVLRIALERAALTR
jgi:carboxyl-terminal processing protease